MFVRIEPETGTDLANSPRPTLYMRTSTINNESISPKTVLTVRVKLDRVIQHTLPNFHQAFRNAASKLANARLDARK